MHHNIIGEMHYCTTALVHYNIKLYLYVRPMVLWAYFITGR